jgi:predicted MFS family arabinose efflux permease
METSFRLLGQRRFLPLFVTQFLGAFNDNLFKMAMVVLVTFTIYNDPKQEEAFNALAGAIFILPFFLLSAVAGQLADTRDKAWLIRIIKTAEILIMVVGAAGLLLHNIPLMLLALFAMGVHSTFFGPIKYAILPQHLDKDHVLGGTGLVEAGTYIAILMGTVVGGIIPSQWAAVGVLVVAVIGRLSGGQVPPAPQDMDAPGFRFDWNIFTASVRLVRDTMHVTRLFRAIMAISFFWAIGAIFAAQFPPLVKNVLEADQTVATLFTALFSVGVAIGSVAVNRLLKGEVSARYSPASVIVMGLFVLDLWWTTRFWPTSGGALMNWHQFIAIGRADRVLFDLLGISIAGGMFVVPLYAFLTTTVDKTETARTVAANNIVNSGAMVLAAILLLGLSKMNVSVSDTLLLVAVSTVVAAWIAWRLHKACD